jgi:phosphomannomutase
MTPACMTARPAAALLFFLVLLGPTFVRIARRLGARLSPRALDWLGGAVLLGLTAYVYWDLAQGHAPLIQDHNAHLIKVVETEQLLHRGRLWGWSELEGAGYPANVFYPWLGYVFAAVLHALPWVSLERAYAYTVFAAIFIEVIAPYVLGRMYLSRTAGMLASLGMLLLPGTWWTPGNFMRLEVGIWPSAAALGLALVGVGQIPRALEAATLRPMAWAGALLGVAVLVHPAALLLTVVSAPPLLAAVVQTRPDLGVRKLAIAALALVLAAAAVCAAWLVPFTLGDAFKHFVFFWGESMQHTEEVVLHGDLLSGPQIVVGIAFCGFLLLAARKDPFSRFVVFFVPYALIVFNQDLVERLGLNEGPRPLVGVLQIARLRAFTFPLCFLAAGHALNELWPRAARFLGERGIRALVGRVFVAAVFATIASARDITIPNWPIKAFPDQLDAEHRRALGEIMDLVQARALPGERVALYSQEFDHTLLAAAGQRHLPNLKMGSHAATMHEPQFYTEQPAQYWPPRTELMRHLGTAYLVSRGTPPAPFDHWERLAQRGEYLLFAVPRASRAWLDGPGQVTVVRWTEEEIVLEVHGSAPGGRLQLGLGYFDAWRDAATGIAVESFDAQGSKLAALPARDGTITLVYRKPWREWLGLLISLGSALALGLLVRRRPGPEPLPEVRLDRPAAHTDRSLALPRSTSMALSPQLTQQARQWLEGDPDAQTRAELEKLLAEQNEAELSDRFGARLEFGTAGLRGTLGAGPNRMNRAVVRRTTLGLARYLKAQVKDVAQRGVVIGRDGRIGSPEFLEDTAAVLCAEGIPAHVFEGVVPTPLVAHAVEALHAAAGVMVTASHNPPEYNGYKVYWGNGAQIIPPHDEGIAAAIDAVGPAREVKLLGQAQAGALWQVIPPAIEEGYFKALAALPLHPEVPRDLAIAYTPMHGVGNRFARRALADAGFARVESVAEQAEPDGRFPTVKFPNPEEPGAMDLVLALARKLDAELCLANDPDADRLAVAVRTAKGQYQQLTGNEVGILLGHYLLTEGKQSADRLVITTIVSSSQLGVMARALGVAYEETLTGFKWIANRAMALKESAHQEFVFGFEEALGYTVGTVARDKDGIGAALMVAELAAVAKARGRTLLEELGEIQRRFGLFAASQKSVTMPGASGAQAIKKIMASFRAQPPQDVAGLAVQAVSDLFAGTRRTREGALSTLDLPPSDVLVYALQGDARIVLRPSGTEPKIKFYFELKEAVAAGEPLPAARARAQVALEKLQAAFMALVQAHTPK